jgi:hypothetical protein
MACYLCEVIATPLFRASSYSLGECASLSMFIARTSACFWKWQEVGGRVEVRWNGGSKEEGWKSGKDLGFTS